DLAVFSLDDGDVLLPVARRGRDLLDGDLHGARVEHQPPVGEAVEPVEAAVRVEPPVPHGVHRAAERRAVPAPHEALRRRERAPPPVARREGERHHLPRATRRPYHGERGL
ncbi:Os02g0199666, partial [Oryza sativa Japonica Group]